jgi:hypothetical protein
MKETDSRTLKGSVIRYFNSCASWLVYSGQAGQIAINLIVTTSTEPAADIINWPFLQVPIISRLDRCRFLKSSPLSSSMTGVNLDLLRRLPYLPNPLVSLTFMSTKRNLTPKYVPTRCRPYPYINVAGAMDGHSLQITLTYFSFWGNAC